MHKDLVPRLICPACRKGDQPLELVSFQEEGNRVLNGILKCSACAAWYPVQESLLELVIPDLLDAAGLEAFVRQFGPELDRLNCAVPRQESGQSALDAQKEQREHFDWYADNESQDYTSYQNTPFWRAEDAVVFKRWFGLLTRKDGWLLDVGCADGRSAFQWARGAGHVVGCDISKKMIRKAILRARAEGLADKMTFFVADADSLPLRDNSFDYACTYGVLHHLPDPGKAYRAIIGLLQSGGIYFASENNKSVFRGVFDWLMRVAPLWTELAGEEPLISDRMVSEWSRNEPVEVTSWTSVFAPPHVFNWLGQRCAKPALRISDALCRWIPWYGRQGGVLVFESRKR